MKKTSKAAAVATPMTRPDVTALIVSARIQKGLSWAKVAKKVGQSKEWTTAACSRTRSCACAPRPARPSS